MKFIKHIPAILLILCGYTTLLFFRHYHSHIIPYPFLWLLLGLLFYYMGLWLYSYSSRTRPARIELSRINVLKNSGERIQVILDDCKILSTESIKTMPEHSEIMEMIGGRTLRAFDMSFDDGSPVGSTIYQSVIVFEREALGHKQKFISQVISKEETTLEFLLASRKTTTLYINRNNASDYYFDLEFLDN